MHYTILTYNPRAATHRNKEISADEARMLPLTIGMPFLVDIESGEVHEAALLFIAAHAKRIRFRRTGIFTPGTTMTYANGIKQFLEFLQRDGVALADVGADHVTDYLDELLDRTSALKGELLLFATIRTWLSIALRLLAMTNDYGMTSASVDDEYLIWCVNDIERESLGAPDGGSRGASAWATRQRLTRCMSPDEWQKIAAQLGSLRRSSSDPRSARDRLATELSVAAGLRVDEAVNVPVSEFENRQSSDLEFVPIRLSITKGLRPRTANIPGPLFRDCVHYADFERREAIELGTARGTIVDHGRLFVNGPKSGRRCGEALRKSTLQLAFFKANMAANLTVAGKVQTDQSSALGVGQIPRFRYHDTRHTFAVWLYNCLTRDLKMSEPWLLLQTALGHRSIETTRKYYLKLADFREQDASNLLAVGLNHALRS